MTSWQPIETAPNYCMLLLCRQGAGGPYLGGFYEVSIDGPRYKGLHIFTGPYDMQIASAPELNVPMPTHWMSVPELPSDYKIDAKP